MSVERLEVAASGLSFVMGTFPLLSVKRRKKKKKIQRKREEEQINIYNYKNREENQTEKKRHNITNLAT